jgi:hypothetical protein
MFRNNALRAVAVAVLALSANGSARAQEEPPCDFITGDGYIIAPSGGDGTFSFVGGCKHGSFFGTLEYHDYGFTPPLDVYSSGITGYLWDPSGRRLCGTAATNYYGDVVFRINVQDNGEPGAGADRFAITLIIAGFRVYRVPFTTIEGGNIQLHKPNPSTTGAWGGCD